MLYQTFWLFLVILYASLLFILKVVDLHVKLLCSTGTEGLSCEKKTANLTCQKTKHALHRFKFVFQQLAPHKLLRYKMYVKIKEWGPGAPSWICQCYNQTTQPKTNTEIKRHKLCEIMSPGI